MLWLFVCNSVALFAVRSVLSRPSCLRLHTSGKLANQLAHLLSLQCLLVSAMLAMIEIVHGGHPCREKSVNFQSGQSSEVVTGVRKRVVSVMCYCVAEHKISIWNNNLTPLRMKRSVNTCYDSRSNIVNVFMMHAQRLEMSSLYLYWQCCGVHRHSSSYLWSWGGEIWWGLESRHVVFPHEV